jgi:hypothetical protein
MRRPCNEVVDLLVQMGVELQTYGRMSVQLVYLTCCCVLKTGPIKSFRSRSHSSYKSYTNYGLANPYHLSFITHSTNLHLSLHICALGRFTTISCILELG